MVYRSRRHWDEQFYAVKVTYFDKYKDVIDLYRVVSNPNNLQKDMRKKVNNMKMALKEAKLLASLCHPNIVQFKEAFFDRSTSKFCIVQEYMNIGNLEDKIKE